MQQLKTSTKLTGSTTARGGERAGRGGQWPSLYLHSKEKGKTAETIKRLSQQGQNVTVLAILKSLKFKNVSYGPTTVDGNSF